MICRIMILVGILLAHPVWADRVALVIGNANYDHKTPLRNPLNDASDIGDALERLEFKVTRLENTSHQEMKEGLEAFEHAASGADLAVLFYAGHGIELGGKNYLIPVDAEIESDSAIKYQTVPLDLVVSTLEDVEGLGLVILDACRDNPFSNTRSAGRGLARVEPSGNDNDMVVAYAAREGTTASDGTGHNSPYTTALLAHLEEPGLEVQLLFPKVAETVRESTNKKQKPVTYGNFPSKKIFLAGRPAPTEGQASPSPTQPNPDTRLLADSLYWERIKDSDEPSDFEDYLKEFPDGKFVRFAREALSHAKAVARGAHRGRELLSEYGSEAMHWAALYGTVDAMEWLKAQGADINAQDNDGKTPMHDAALGTSVDAMKWLKAQGADINAQDNDDRTPMHGAALGDSVDALKWLKAQGADTNARDRFGNTPMHSAARGDAVEAMKWLKAQGADINAQDNDGETPMHDAAFRDAVEAMEWLKVQGADINARDNYGVTPMHDAARYDSVDALKWLKVQGADINARDNYGVTPMHDAARHDSVDALKWLRANGGRK